MSSCIEKGRGKELFTQNHPKTLYVGDIYKEISERIAWLDNDHSFIHVLLLSLSVSSTNFYQASTISLLNVSTIKMLLNVSTVKIMVEFLDFHYLLSKTQAWPNSEMTLRLCLKILYPVIASTSVKPTPAAERTHLPWIYIHVHRPGFPGSSSVKNLSANAEDADQSLGWEDPRRRKWQLTPVFMPREFHGQRSLVGYSPWGCKSQTWLSHWTIATILEEESVYQEFSHKLLLLLEWG